jgi:hypothetical protein
MGLRRDASNCTRRQIGDGFGAQCIDPDGPRDVLDALLTHVVERVGQPVADLVAHRPGNADPSGLGERLQARCDIDSVAEDVAVFGDHVAEVDADPEPDAPLVGDHGLTVDHPALHFGGAAHRVNDAPEFREQAVAGILDDAAPVLRDLWIDQLTEMRLQALVRAFLIRPHQARIARHIGGEDRGETAGRGHGSSSPPWAKVRFA